MSLNQFRGAVEWALMVALVFGAGAIAQAQDEEAQVDAKVIQIGPADGLKDAPQLPAPDGGEQARPAAPKYWIGFLGGPVTPDLRHHVEIPENEGVMIREVVPDSPAAKAGIEQYDIVLRANDAPLHDMRDLVDIVRTEGEKKGQITLEVFRHGERETVYITPEERPARVAQHGGGFGGEHGLGGDFGGLAGVPELQQFFGRGHDGGPAFDLRRFGPGAIVGGGGAGVAGMPSGVSISVQKKDGEPARITVQRGEESWEVVGDDPESLNQLPEDLRPFVEQMLHGGGVGNFDMPMPTFGDRPGFDGERLRERLEAMERRLEEMHERLLAPRDQTEDQAPSDDHAEEQAE